MKRSATASTTMSYEMLLEFRLHSRHELAPREERNG